MFRTRITELFGIKHPILLAGMNQVTHPELVAAVSNAGGLGVLAISGLTLDQTRKYIRDIRKLTDKPFGINQALIRPLAKEKIDIAIEEKVRVVCYSLGKPWFMDRVHAYGGKVVGSVAMSKHATKAAELGVDALIVTGHEAAGHGGSVTSLVLIPVVASVVKTPLIAAGGFSDGRGLAAALALGAEAVSMGTRFMVTKECRVKEPFKQLILRATEEDTFYSAVFDGLPSRVLKSQASEEMMSHKGFHLSDWISSGLAVKRMMNLSWWEFLQTSWRMRKGEERLGLIQQALLADHVTRQGKAIEGDVAEGILVAGQSSGGVKDIPTCQELVDRIVAEAEEVLNEVRSKMVSKSQ